MYRNLLLTLILLLIACSSSLADRRKYAWTYQFVTIPKDAVEMEFYQTTRLKQDEPNLWEYRIEVEHGITNRWDISVYQIFSQVQGEAFRWDAFQIRTRVKLAEPGRFVLNPLLYLEYRRKAELAVPNKIEAKFVLGRNFGRWNLAVNPVYELFWAPGKPTHEIGLDVGCSRELSYKVSLGLEAISRIELLEHEKDHKSLYLGPAMSLASGPAFYTVGYAIGVTGDSDDARVRFLMGVML
ncbi:MAG: hypothetical protein JSU65_13985 [Candidatus Zixiibacteriota bacterium]|nr:MAG: hypothetical protein JSU65_13985 [candidate division Zixibacteria bacterium]